MESAMSEFVMGMIAALVAGGVAWVAVRRLKRGTTAKTTIFSSIDQLRAIGELSVYKVMTKEIVTETDHTWGEVGSRYLSWVLSNKKMAMIFEFVIDFRYNLQHSSFDIRSEAENRYTIQMPPCQYEVNIRDIRFYDEQGSKLFPWLLPDLLNGFLGGRFSEEDKNRIIDSAKKHAEQQALQLIESVQSEVQKSAKSTLESISRAFGAIHVDFDFATKAAKDRDIDVALSDKIAS